MPVQERVTSRLVKREQKKMLKQTIWFAILGLLLVTAFIFFVLPNFIRIVNAVLNTEQVSVEETVLLQAPSLSAPVQATKSAQLKLTGYSTAGLATVIVVNGEPTTPVTPDQTGGFETMITLTEGENEVVAFARDAKNNESPMSHSYMVILDTKPPKMELKEPADKRAYENKEKLIQVSGLAEPDARLYLNDRFFTPRADGTFSSSFALVDGENKIRVKAVDPAGNETQVERVVTYKP